MKVSDYIFQYIADLGIGHVFCISGHGNLHLIDSLGKNPNLKYIATQHEQAAATAAEAYAKITENMGAAVVTTGPGSTNSITGVASAWLDSVPVIYISGQVNVPESIRDTKVRQFGIQEINIIDIVGPITKYAVTVTDPRDIKYHLRRATYEAKNNRPGPVWLAIPLDVSHTEIDPDTLKDFNPEPLAHGKKNLSGQIQEVVRLLRETKRPVILGGAGVKRARARKEFLELVEKLRFPVLTTYSGADLIADDHTLSFGRPGVNGTRSANFVIQNCDLLLSIGSRLPLTVTTSRPQTFARAAQKIMVDIDPAELHKNWLEANVFINSDAKVFMETLLEALANFRGQEIEGWVQKCQSWKKAYPVVLPEYHKQQGGVNSFLFLDTLSDELQSDDIFIHDMGSSFSCTMQTFKVKSGQYISSNYGMAGMGYFLPACIGSWFGRGERKRVVAVCGDGGLQMTIQEFQTLKHNNIPLKIFILNNHSYLTIKQSQNAYFQGRYVDSTPESGYSTPDFLKIAGAYGLSSASITNQVNLKSEIRKVLDTPGPVICDVLMPDDQLLIPKLQAKVVNGKYIQTPLEDMYPFLPREEFLKNMLIEPLEEK